jgi:hypothetical protein
MTLARTTLFASLLLTALVPSIASADVVRFGAGGAGDGLRASYHGGLTVAPSGDVYALDPDPYNRVLRFTPGFAFAGTWGDSGSGNGEFNLPRGVAITTDGDVLVGEANGYRVQRFTPAGSYLGTMSTMQVQDLAAGRSGEFYVANGGAITRHDSAGVQIAQWDGSSATPTVGYTSAIAYDAVSDRVFALDSQRSLVRVLDGADLHQIGTWGSRGTAPGKFDSPSGIAVDPSSHNVYVAEAGTVGSTMRVQRFSSDGTLRGVYLPRADNGGAEQPGALAVDTSGRLYVAAFGSLLRVDPDQPVARLSAWSTGVYYGQTVQLDGTASGVPFGDADRISWDLDGDGSFETDGGLTRETSFATLGTHTVAVRVEDGPLSDTASLTFNVRPLNSNPGPLSNAIPQPQPQPATGSVGVSIEDGALFTNDPNVTLDIDAPASAATVIVSNDGGFKHARSFPAGRRIKWKLASTGPERLPKTVYVRFGSSTQNYTDDIILDQTKPTISSATVDASGATATSATVATAAASRSRTFRMRIRAKDATSGVAKVQFAVTKAKPTQPRTYSRTIKYRATKAPRFVRVRDRAGNYSRWHSIRASR